MPARPRRSRPVRSREGLAVTVCFLGRPAPPKVGVDRCRRRRLVVPRRGHRDLNASRPRTGPGPRSSSGPPTASRPPRAQAPPTGGLSFAGAGSAGRLLHPGTLVRRGASSCGSSAAGDGSAPAGTANTTARRMPITKVSLKFCLRRKRAASGASQMQRHVRTCNSIAGFGDSWPRLPDTRGRWKSRAQLMWERFRGAGNRTVKPGTDVDVLRV